jgi:hypothetical protein
MPNQTAKILQWKAGEEKDCKGFYWSTKLAVQQSWEQHNAVEDVHNYRTFRSAIHITMIPIICFELMIERSHFDIISDAELMDRLDAKLKPTGPAEYLIKLRQIKFNNSDKSGTLLHRYRAFAEPFLQLISEAAEAGCPINDESTKLAFKAACRPNELLMMFLQQDRWTGAASAHQCIMGQLRNFNSLQTLQSLNTNGVAPAAEQFPPPPANQQHQIPPPPAHQQFHHQPVTPGPRFQQPRPQSAMVNLMSQLLERFDNQERARANSTTPAQHFQTPSLPVFQSPPPAAHMNYGQATASPNKKQHNLTPHPDLDARGPFWHPSDPAHACRFTPCTVPFCQGCGRHGHTAADCANKHRPGWNASGYYSDKYPGQGALIFPSANPRTTTTPQLSTLAAPAPFPTPHRMNNAGGRVSFADATSELAPSSKPFQSVARSNHAGSQTPADGNSGPSASSAQ